MVQGLLQNGEDIRKKTGHGLLQNGVHITKLGDYYKRALTVLLL